MLGGPPLQLCGKSPSREHYHLAVLTLPLLVRESRLSLFGKRTHPFLLIGRSEQLLEQSTFESKSFSQGEFIG